MPCSQVHQMTKGNLNPRKLKMSNCSTDLPYSSDNDFVELLWENGQVVMQSHSGRTRKSSLSPKDGDDAAFVKAGKYAVPEYNASGTSTSGPSGRVYTAHDDDLVPCWLNRPVEDSLPGDYCPEFFTDLSYANPKPPSEQHCSVPVQRNGRFSQPLGDPKVVSAHEDANLEHENVPKAGVRGSDLVKFRSSQLFQSSQQCPAPDPKSGVSTFLPGNMQQSHCQSSSTSRVSATGLLNSMQLKNDPLPTRPLQPCNKGLMNFSHFSSPASLFKANLQNSGFPGAGASGNSKFRGSDKAPLKSSNPIEPSVVKSTSSLRSNSEELISARAKVDPKPPNTTPQEVGTAKESEAVRREDALRNRRSPDHLIQSSSFAASFALGHPKGEKAFVTSVASSSACSGYSTEGVSHDAKRGLKRKGQVAEESECQSDVSKKPYFSYGLKRKGQVAEESECQSDDAEDESVDVKRPTKSLKRSRSAEVHNLSERRRRDRINEKMRALQELIPNCNKTDRASMLDEAIEYLKTLQLQVQIMSMGTGLCMPPMMFPAGIQKIRPTPIPHFPPMGIGMSMGFGMGMNDISRSTGYPLISVPPMQGLQFPCTSVSGFTGLHGLPGTSAPMFGFPGQALPSSLPRTPFIPVSGFSTALLSVPDLSVAAVPMPVPNSSLPSSPKDQIQNASLRKDA